MRSWHRLKAQPDRCRRLVAFGALALALLLAQTLGVLHGLAHGVHGFDTPSQAARQPDLQVAGLFDAHEDESTECRLFDQSTHGDLLWLAATLFAEPAHAPTRTQSAAQAPRAASTSWFRARAPPQRA